MPALFIGHGSPMNAITHNRYTQMLSQLGQRLPKPQAILCVSAHWMTEGTQITSGFEPKTIHDFYGFPEELFNVRYPARGAPEMAFGISTLIHSTEIKLDNGAWGLDHGAWSVLKHMYPEADVPVLQLSLDVNKTESQHLQLATELSQVRDRGVMIIGSGNIVHNLRLIKWQADAPPYEWATQFDEWFKKNLKTQNHDELTFHFTSSESGRLSVPTVEHYWPALYALGASRSHEQVEIFYEEIQNSSISMTCFGYGL